MTAHPWHAAVGYCHHGSVNSYWNHNTAYHRWLVTRLARHHGDVLDVGSGDGLLLERCAPVSRTVTGIDPDVSAMMVAAKRLTGVPDAVLIHDDFLAHDFGPTTFDAVIFVASLHHMDSAAALRKATALLRPSGVLLVVALVKPTLGWTLLDLARWPAVRLSGSLHRESGPEVPVRLTEPTQTLAQMRATARALLPGATIRYGLYYRCLLEWVKPDRRGT